MFQKTGEAFQKFVSKVVVLFALAAETLAIECDGAGHIQNLCIKHIVVWRYQPGPSQDITLPQRLDRNVAAIRGEELESDAPFPNEVELIRLVPHPKDILILFEPHVRGATCHER